MPSPFGFSTPCEDVAKTFADRIKGRTFLITGTSPKGLGANAALELARHGPAHLILVSRSKDKTEPVLREIAEAAPGVRTTFVQCELSDFDSVRAAAAQINGDQTITAIDVVINNAGVMAIKEYTLDKQGNEVTLSSNHLGHFLLTNLTLPKVLAAGPCARIVNVTSHGHRISNFRFDDYNFSGGKAYEKWTAYGQSKTANMLFSVSLAEKLGPRGISSFSVHPGTIFGTGLATHLDNFDIEEINDATARNNGPGRFWMEETKTLSQGTAPILAAALDPELEQRNGYYVDNCQLGQPESYGVDPEAARRLWALSEGLVGQTFSL